MATPTLTRHSLDGALGPVAIDVRAGGREAPRPAVVVLHGFKGFKDWGMFPPLAERLARAGFSAVSLNVSGSGVDAAGSFAYPERFGHNTYSAELADLAGFTSENIRRLTPDMISAGLARKAGKTTLFAKDQALEWL